MEFDDFKSICDILAEELDQDDLIGLDKPDMYSNTPLVTSILNNDVKKGTYLLEKGFFASNMSEPYTYLTPLHNAAQINDSAFLELLVKALKEQVNVTDSDGNTPLHYAAWYRNRKYAEILINNGAKVTAVNSTKNTPLHLACASNNPNKDHSCRLEEFLISSGSDVNSINDKGQTPVMVLFTLEGEDFNIKKSNKFDPISTLSIFFKCKNLKVTHKDNFGRTLLHYSCIRGKVWLIFTRYF